MQAGRCPNFVLGISWKGLLPWEAVELKELLEAPMWVLAEALAATS